MTTTDLALTGPEAQIMALGQVMAKSGLFNDARDANRAFVKILAGQELGLGPVASMRGLHIVEGKIELSGTTIAAQIKRSRDYDYRVEQTDSECTVRFFQVSEAGQREEIGATTWTLADAVRAGLCKLKEDGTPLARSSQGKALPWEAYPRVMLFNRAMSEGARTHVPDVFNGPVYSEGEISDSEIVTGDEVGGSVEPAGSVVEGLTPSASPTTPPEPSAQTPLSAEAGTESEAPENGQEGAEETVEPDETEAPGQDDSAPTDYPAEIERLRAELNWTQGKVLKLARENIGDHIKTARWNTLSDEDGRRLVELLRAA